MTPEEWAAAVTGEWGAYLDGFQIYTLTEQVAGAIRAAVEEEREAGRVVMYEVHPDDKGCWVLYEVGGGGFEVVAWFADRDDAEFARQAFQQRGETRTRSGGGPRHPPGTRFPDSIIRARGTT